MILESIRYVTFC